MLSKLIALESSLVIERVYEAIDNLYLEHDLIQNSSLEDKEEMYKKQELEYYVILDKYENYDK